METASWSVSTGKPIPQKFYLRQDVVIELELRKTASLTFTRVQIPQAADLIGLVSPSELGYLTHSHLSSLSFGKLSLSGSESKPRRSDWNELPCWH
jgi:hypothetical protein